MSSLLNGKTILVVDDEEDLRSILCIEFQMQGCKTLEAASGNQAVAILAQHEVDAIVSDIRMPDGNGMQLLEKVRSKNREIPVMFLITGFADVSDPEAYAKGAGALFKKPFHPLAIVEAVERALSEPNARWGTGQEAQPPSRRVEVVLPSYEVAESSGLFGLGSGGVFVHVQEPLPYKDDVVDFRISFQDQKDACIEGTGVIRWIRGGSEASLPPGCGIEFLSLSDPARATVLRLLDKNAPKAFIPFR